ncbi:GNAT family N-acetyltransferase [Streptomyces sp. TRM43335]|uniref:GNAT family N-acetyltransferase n=1 Tax=Streptomyces taklimakanensis TaxID=2569853 RepID=A0A6G2BBU4_9ACTN|nr:GNAT family N-acetyltransferase [Streptomyces taklimakanensis]MTE19745.1 GNAT family N-acetyltransferase [Streptomyces taklimakanensis]
MSLTSPVPVALRPLDEELLRALLATAVAEAEPREVMPPVEDAAGGAGGNGAAGPVVWTDALREAFSRFHRFHSLGPGAPQRTYAVVVTEPGEDGLPEETVAGAARLAPRPEPDAVEAGLWLGRSHRGRGVGTRVLALLREEARRGGAARLFAGTGSANAAARRLLSAAGADLERHADGSVTAWVALVGQRSPTA